MKEATKSFLTAAAGLMLVGSMWARPAARAHRSAVQAMRAKSSGQSEAQTKSAQGEITAVTPTTITIEAQEKNGAVDPLTFTINAKSTIEGKLAEGATADVTYRVENGKDVAVSVQVTRARTP